MHALAHTLTYIRVYTYVCTRTHGSGRALRAEDAEIIIMSGKKRHFQYDQVFDQLWTQKRVYEATMTIPMNRYG